MLSLVVSGLAFGFGAPGAAPSAAVRASEPGMILGLGKKSASKVVAKGVVVPTRNFLNKNKASTIAEASAAFADAAAQFALAAQGLEGAAPAGVVQKPFSTPTKTADSPITLDEVNELQTGWANAIKTISATYKSGGDYVGTAGEAAGELYGYSHSQVLFKPTKAAEYPFRPTGGEAMSYFVGHEAVAKGYKEDGGFAINGGKGWENVVFTNHQIDLNGQTAIAMGSYVFTCATTGEEAKVEYTFGYKRNADGKARIFLHHSSVPYAAAPADASALAPVSAHEVQAAQESWANAIKTISKTYLEKGDYVSAAGEAAGELYGYGHTNVLFKPTKAAEYPFRPTGAEAMSYFVGCDAVQDGYKEDGGFAINGGKGWKDVVFTNHQIECHGEVAIAMGSYVFSCATTGEETKVEYTFGYKRNEDGNVRICLHHSSVPYSA